MAISSCRNVEFHPMLFRQHEALPHKEAESFNKVKYMHYTLHKL